MTQELKGEGSGDGAVSEREPAEAQGHPGRVAHRPPGPGPPAGRGPSVQQHLPVHPPGPVSSGRPPEARGQLFLRQEILPYTRDAWYDPASVEVSYEISVNRYFYQPKPLRSLEEIRADLLEVGKGAEGLVAEILWGGSS